MNRPPKEVNRQAWTASALLRWLTAMAGLFVVTSCDTAEKSNSRAKEINGEGLAAHEVKRARQEFHVDGSGVKVCVISDSVRYLGETRGISKRDVAVLPGQDGIREDKDGHKKDRGEGTAMLEIVHSIAPGAELMFATSGTEADQMAFNIKTLAKHKCKIIVDDIPFHDQSPFQDDEIAQAINKVTGQGVLYITSAGNEGNTHSGSSGAWEGYFRAGRTLSDGATAHVFAPGVQDSEFNAILGECGRHEEEKPIEIDVYLYWNDPIPQIGCCYDAASLSDYQLLAFDSKGALMKTVPADRESKGTPEETEKPVQDVRPHTRDDKPFRHIRVNAPNKTDSNRTWLMIAKASGKADRFLHLDFTVKPGGCWLQYQTAGAITGNHGAAAALSVASKAALKNDSRLSSEGAFVGGPYEHVDYLSSEGPRRLFFTPGGTPYTSPQILEKPDVTAADGVTTDIPGFKPFFGTSAAAPQVAGIAALMWSKNPHLTAEQIKDKLRSSAIQIEGNDTWNSLSGYGIVNAVRALRAVEPLTAEAANETSGPCCRNAGGSLK